MSDKTSPLIILKIKRRAKGMRKSHPDIVHSKRLDLAAKEIMGVDTFREARKKVESKTNGEFQ